MPRDELRQPLRQRSTAERLWAKRPTALTLACGLAVLGFVSGSTWVARLPHPFAGEPVVTAAIPPVEELKTAATDAVADSATEVAPAEAEPSPDAQFVAPQQDTPQDEATIIISPRRPLKPAPFAIVTETGADGPLPRVATSGKTPAEAYAQITPMSAMVSERPKIAILLGGMGLNPRLTQKAIKELPGNITFGFAPYGNALQDQVNRARAEGHEVMLQLPMEPLGYPANDPGPNTLLAEGAKEDNLKALRWNMSRFAGYTGITNYMGSRFLATPAGLQPVLAELKTRGLLFLEDASVTMTAAQGMADAAGLRMRHAEVAIDVNADAASIQAALASLEKQARGSGMAIGTGSGLEVTIDTVADWAKDLESRGFILVPVSALYQGRRS